MNYYSFFSNFSSFIILIFLVDSTHPKIEFWNQQRRGANIFNRLIHQDDIKDAKKLGLEFIRLAPDKFTPKHTDFLTGNTDNFKAIIKEDLNHLIQVLDMFHEEHMPVILTMISLPGLRWKQHNNNKVDSTLWLDSSYLQKVCLFWQELAYHLKDHSAIVAYDIYNEPFPESVLHNPSQALHQFYTMIIKAIRTVDRHTPIIVKSSLYADPQQFTFQMPYDDPYILYAFHMYEPYSLTCFQDNQNQFSYPGIIKDLLWYKDQLKKYIKPVRDFQKTFNIPNNRLIVTEFGCNRHTLGIQNYFADLIELFNEYSWHFSFYAFREDTWDGMDYELSDLKIPYYQLYDQEGNLKDLRTYRDSSCTLFNTLTLQS